MCVVAVWTQLWGRQAVLMPCGASSDEGQRFVWKNDTLTPLRTMPEGVGGARRPFLLPGVHQEAHEPKLRLPRRRNERGIRLNSCWNGPWASLDRREMRTSATEYRGGAEEPVNPRWAYTEGALWKAPAEHTQPLEGRGRQQPQDAWPCFCMGASNK